ncbi:hypothetical protein [Streptomyces mexicanus]|jgi:hypothetical protein|uniref:hypothetical protein n=1 Tax=Streptomyces mexicanus TaxID=178566 RepID=UPI0031ED34E9
MRRTTLPRTTPVTVAAAAALLLAAGCGARDGSAGPPASVPPSGASRTPAGPGTPDACTAHAELGTADSGRTLCLTAGGELRLRLEGSRDRPWSPVRATGTALKAVNAGIVILPGDALAAYRAVAPGTARLTSSRPPCPTGPGHASCQGPREWTVTVRVTRS